MISRRIVSALVIIVVLILTILSLILLENDNLDQNKPLKITLGVFIALGFLVLFSTLVFIIFKSIRKIVLLFSYPVKLMVGLPVFVGAIWLISLLTLFTSMALDEPVIYTSPILNGIGAFVGIFSTIFLILSLLISFPAYIFDLTKGDMIPVPALLGYVVVLATYALIGYFIGWIIQKRKDKNNLRS